MSLKETHKQNQLYKEGVCYSFKDFASVPAVSDVADWVCGGLMLDADGTWGCVGEKAARLQVVNISVENTHYLWHSLI